jgi:hypothetical protein
VEKIVIDMTATVGEEKAPQNKSLVLGSEISFDMKTTDQPKSGLKSINHPIKSKIAGGGSKSSKPKVRNLQL